MFVSFLLYAHLRMLVPTVPLTKSLAACACERRAPGASVQEDRGRRKFVQKQKEIRRSLPGHELSSPTGELYSIAWNYSILSNPT